MPKSLQAFIAAAAVVGLATAAQAGGGCGGMYTTSLDVATDEHAPMSTPAESATVATDTTVKQIVPDQSGG